MSEHKNQDVDLLDVFKWLKQLWVNLWINVYRFFSFLIRNVLILVALLIVGVGLGYGLSTFLAPKYEVELIVKPNLGTTSYLYQKIDELDNRESFKSTDGNFVAIDAIEIEPVKNIADLLENLSEIPTEIIPDVTDYRETESEFYEKTLFTPGYTFHQIKLVSREKIAVEDLSKGLEASPFLQEKLVAARKSTEAQLQENQFSINQIDSLLQNFNSQLKQSQTATETSKLSVYNGSEISQIYASVLNSKTELLEIQDELVQQQLDLQDIFKIYSVSDWKSKSSLKTYLPFLMPLFLIFGFLLITFFLRLRIKLRNLSTSSVR